MIPEGPIWQRATAFAASRHAGQLRKDNQTPYVSHVFRVAFTLRDLFGCDDPDALAAALLHDTIEDTRTDYDDIELAFGPRVADLVASLTKNQLLPEPEREVEYDRRLARADKLARLVKLADVYDNLCDADRRADAGPETLAKLLGRCDRAIALATPDADDARVARAIEIVRAARARASINTR